jgi:hypothetical protein
MLPTKIYCLYKDIIFLSYPVSAPSIYRRILFYSTLSFSILLTFERFTQMETISTDSLATYNHIIDTKCFDYDKVIRRQNLKQEWVNELRERAKNSKCVPKIIDDKHVRILFFFIDVPKLKVKINLFYFIFICSS